MAIERQNLCPNCGAKLTGLEFKCPECGYVLTKETAAGQTTTDAILDLQEKLIAVDKVFGLGISSSKKKASIINSFPIPNTVESLTRLLHLSYSNFEASKESGDKRIANAWLGKAVESYRRLSEMQGDTNISETLEKYKMLGDKNAFVKLTGSRAKKRWFALAEVAILASLVAFILWFDWASLLIRNGKQEIAVHLLSFLGKRDKVIDVLINNDHLEDAANLLASEGQTLRAIEILSQKGLIANALIMAGNIASADSIHAAIDLIEKWCVIINREEFYLDKNTVINKSQNWSVSFYDRNQFKIKRILDLDKMVIVWEDYWKVNKDIQIPEPHYYVYSVFRGDYRSYADWRNCPSPEITRNRMNFVNRIKIGENQGWSGEKEYLFDYGTLGVQLQKESVFYLGHHIIDIIYDYYDNIVSSVSFKYLLTKEEVGKYFTEADNVRSEAWSYRDEYVYENGKLAEIIRKSALEGWNDYVMQKTIFKHIGNLRIVESLYRESSEHDSLIADSEKVVEIYLDGDIQEQFSIKGLDIGNAL